MLPPHLFLKSVIDKNQLQSLQQLILQTLRQNPRGLSEYELLQTVKEHSVIQSLQGLSNRQLFRRHFVLRHCVYSLQQQLWDKNGEVVSITPLMIAIKPASKKSGDELPGETLDSGLRDYYLNWDNFETTEAEVDDLLNNFWKDYIRFINQDEAWEILGLPAGSSKQDITTRYRELAARHHPDKGGDREMFVKIRAAYESLRTTNK